METNERKMQEINLLKGGGEMNAEGFCMAPSDALDHTSDFLLELREDKNG